MFSHMAVMYTNALYQRDFVREGYHVLNGIYEHSQDFAVSRMYPGLPEYVTPRGRGVYPYLTGSASWYLLTLITEVFGVQGDLGNLRLAPRLVQEQFDAEGRASIHTLFADRALDIVYQNPEALDYGEYTIAAVTLDDAPLPMEEPGDTVRIERAQLTTLDPTSTHRVEITLHART
jgi:hypothetical protein